ARSMSMVCKTGGISTYSNWSLNGGVDDPDSSTPERFCGLPGPRIHRALSRSIAAALLQHGGSPFHWGSHPDQGRFWSFRSDQFPCGMIGSLAADLRGQHRPILALPPIQSRPAGKETQCITGHEQQIIARVPLSKGVK